MDAIDEGGAVLEKNAKLADIWSSGGRAYYEVSQGVSEGIRPWPKDLFTLKDVPIKKREAVVRKVADKLVVMLKEKMAS